MHHPILTRHVAAHASRHVVRHGSGALYLVLGLLMATTFLIIAIILFIDL